LEKYDSQKINSDDDNILDIKPEQYNLSNYTPGAFKDGENNKFDISHAYM